MTFGKPLLFVDSHPDVSSQLSQKQKDELAIIKRGHLGIPEDILKAASPQYASMCGNINNKVCKLLLKFN